MALRCAALPVGFSVQGNAAPALAGALGRSEQGDGVPFDSVAVDLQKVDNFLGV